MRSIKRFFCQSKLLLIATLVSTNLSLATPVTHAGETAYGHFQYAQADPKQMVTITSYRTRNSQRVEKLHPEAGKALMKMIAAARKQGVQIVPVSGFRTIEQQRILFQNQIKRCGSAQAAAKISAPPGYSEHHTGYAIDLADGSEKSQLTENFKNTNAYRWLQLHAHDFGFEMSFPANNSQGVSYEPWHWRFVGSSPAIQVFLKARNID